MLILDRFERGTFPKLGNYFFSTGATGFWTSTPQLSIVVKQEWLSSGKVLLNLVTSYSTAECYQVRSHIEVKRSKVEIIKLKPKTCRCSSFGVVWNLSGGLEGVDSLRRIFSTSHLALRLYLLSILIPHRVSAARSLDWKSYETLDERM